ncbi:MAG: mandelate racemase/muconate lactonizing protein [Akkermansiaceae bacterium]|nr:mandelate racemase/muconate lactonizing protein [Akkermansiaceae bacterium]
MNRRTFLHQTGFAAAAAGIGRLHAADDPAAATLAEHRIESIEFKDVRYRWPRLVGKNSRLGVHGQHHKISVVILRTDQGASGWGVAQRIPPEKRATLRGRRVNELIDPSRGILPGVFRELDFALHDLAGVILDKPVYQLLGAKGPKENLLYSGMIYFDELEPADNPAGLDKVIENCAWDLDHGYRQLKVKIGRSGKWYPHDKGLATDIDIVRRIYRTFKDRGVELLVDANDAYSLEDAIAFLEGVSEIPLFWFEEPFREDRETTGKLRKWMHGNGFGKTLVADGEADPDPAYCLELAREGVLDTILHDTRGYGFTPWRGLIPRLAKLGTSASPHAWGDRFKTNYTIHLAAGLGNCCTIEGVTCESEDVDFGDYPLRDGKVRVSDAPGFGMKLLV